MKDKLTLSKAMTWMKDHPGHENVHKVHRLVNTMNDISIGDGDSVKTMNNVLEQISAMIPNNHLEAMGVDVDSSRPVAVLDNNLMKVAYPCGLEITVKMTDGKMEIISNKPVRLSRYDRNITIMT